ncbi:MAG: 3-dehydroquinate synthase [Opitutae bacterium]|nr:3-dehydroquinate synthase [Opitutae bacterium]
MQEKVVRPLCVGLDERSYEILVGRNLSSVIRRVVESLRESNRQVAILADEQLAILQPTFLAEAFGDCPKLELPSGETTKSLEKLGAVLDFLADTKLDRSACVFVVGGGVTGDLGGFAAASFLRGIDFIQIPSTLLAMVDSSVGGKTGINLSAGKNLVGAFHQPRAVFADLDLLTSLSTREFSAGMAEVIKYGLLGDRDLYQRLLRAETLTATSPDLGDVIRRCCENKARVVEGDERETDSRTGGRALLNLGHTFGHAIEAVAGYGDYLHGEAVAIGMVCALRLSEKLEFLDLGHSPDLEALLSRQGLPTVLRVPLALKSLLNAMHSDKKVKGGRLRFVVMDAIGVSRLAEDVPLSLVEDIWRTVGAS